MAVLKIKSGGQFIQIPALRGEGIGNLAELETTDKSSVVAAINEVKNTMLNLCWPIGSIYIGVGVISPATMFGGTWAVFGAGKTLIGIDSADADFDAVEETRGSKSNRLQYAPGGNTIGLATGEPGVLSYSDRYVVGEAGLNQAVFDKANIQPSIVVRMWKRTA